MSEYSHVCVVPLNLFFCSALCVFFSVNFCKFLMISLCARYRVHKFSFARKIKVFRSRAYRVKKLLFLFAFSRTFRNFPMHRRALFCATFCNIFPRVYRVTKLFLCCVLFCFLLDCSFLCSFSCIFCNLFRACIVLQNSRYYGNIPLNANIYQHPIFPNIREEPLQKHIFLSRPWQQGFNCTFRQQSS